jgi:5'-nucleotidase
VDGGDWSEGNVYYNIGTGAETLRMMDFMGYDVAVVGNHDWLNGPGALLQAYDRAAPHLTLVAANVDARLYDQAKQFEHDIQPYTIRQVGPVKIAFVGVVTYEYIYDKFLKPVRILSPYSVVAELASRLKRQGKADVVVAISHNSIKLNKKLLSKAPALDFVIGAHDHVKLTKPVMVNRFGAAPGFIVETGCWGRFLGETVVKLRPYAEARSAGLPTVELLKYKLHQIDFRIAKDPAADARIAGLEHLIEAQYGPVFHDQIAENETELTRDGQENLIGDVVTDAYLWKLPQADFAIDQVSFMYGELHAGNLRTVDAMNALPAIFNPKTGKTWTLKTIPMRGRVFRTTLNLIFGGSSLMPGGGYFQSSILSASGLSFVFKGRAISTSGTSGPPVLFNLSKSLERKGMLADVSPKGLIIDDLKVRGQPLEDDRVYQVATTDGVIEAIRFVNSILPGAIPIDENGIHDSGIETWRVLAEYVSHLSPLTPDKVTVGNRIQSKQPDLGLFYDDVQVTPERVVRAHDGQSMVSAQVRVRVRNFGVEASKGASTVHLYGNRNGIDQSVDWEDQDLGASAAVPALKSGDAMSYTFEVTIPGEAGLYPLDVRIDGKDQESNLSNNEVIRWISLR